MATPAIPTPPLPTPLANALKNGLTLNIQGTLPGEALMIAIINYATMVRATMDKDLQKRLDAITVQQLEDIEHLWRGIWVELGVLPK